MAHENEPKNWKKSSLSGGDGCVEVAVTGDRVSVRDSKNPGGPTLDFTAHEWRCFLDGVRKREFDLPGSRPAS